MIAFIDAHRENYGVEPICKVLPIAPSTYHARIAGRRDPTKLSARARRDEFATLEWVDWFNNRRLLEPIGNIPPAEAEARYYVQIGEPALAA